MESTKTLYPGLTEDQIRLLKTPFSQLAPNEALSSLLVRDILDANREKKANG